MYEHAYWIDLNGKHSGIRVDIDGITSFVPLDTANTDYQNIMKLVEDGELTIAPSSEATPLAENTPTE